MLVFFLPMKCRQKLVRDIFDTFNTHLGLVHDDADTQSSGTHDNVFFRFVFTLNINL